MRTADGLAHSSRNVYLSLQERRDALVLNNALQLAKRMVESPTINVKVIVDAMHRLIETKKTAKIDYIEIVDAKRLEPLKEIKDKALVALAVWVGKTRLIDNLVVKC